MRKTIISLLVFLLCIGLAGAGVLASEGNVGLNLWFPSFGGFDSPIGYGGDNNPLTLTYPEDDGVEIKGEFMLNKLPVGMAYWSTTNKASFSSEEYGYVTPDLFGPLVDGLLPVDGLEASGEFKAKLFDLYLGKELGVDSGLTLVGGLRNFEITRKEAVDFYGQPLICDQNNVGTTLRNDGPSATYGYDDNSQSSMWGPMVGLKGKYSLGKSKITAGIRVGALVNEMETEWVGKYGEVEAPVTSESTNPVFSADLDLALVLPLNAEVDFEAGYRAIIFTDALGRVHPEIDDDSDLVPYHQKNVETSDIIMSGARMGVVLHF